MQRHYESHCQVRTQRRRQGTERMELNAWYDEVWLMTHLVTSPGMLFKLGWQLLYGKLLGVFSFKRLKVFVSWEIQLRN